MTLYCMYYYYIFVVSAECTDCTQLFPFAVEQAEIDIFSVLVTGKLPYYSLNDVAGNKPLN